MSAFESTYVPAIMERHTVGDRAASVVVEVAGLDISRVFPPMVRRYVAAYVSMSHLTTPRSVRTYTVLESVSNLLNGIPTGRLCVASEKSRLTPQGCHNARLRVQKGEYELRKGDLPGHILVEE